MRDVFSQAPPNVKKLKKISKTAIRKKHLQKAEIGEPNSLVGMNADQWYYSKEDLNETPSILNGEASPKIELSERIKGCHYIIAVGQRLQLPHLVIVTATTFLHRFYMRKSMKAHPVYEAAATCLLVATKVEEATRRLRDIVIACAQKAAKDNRPIIEGDDTYMKWKETLLSKEIVVFETLCFDLSVQHPQKYLLELEDQLSAPAMTVRRAWMFLFASLGSPLCLIYKPNMLAAAALLLASNFSNSSPVKLNDNWYESVEGLDIAELHEVAYDMLNFGTDHYLKSTKGQTSASSSPYPTSSLQSPYYTQQQ